METIYLLSQIGLVVIPALWFVFVLLPEKVLRERIRELQRQMQIIDPTYTPPAEPKKPRRRSNRTSDLIGAGVLAWLFFGG